MSSLQRTRSLRKPTALPADTTARDGDVTAPRNASPSRLPVKHHTRTTSAVSSSRTSSRTNAPVTTTENPAARPRSATLKRTPSTRQQAPAQDPVKKETSRYPPLTRTNRPPVTSARPSSSDGPTASSQAKRAAGHARAKSTTITGVNASTILRPPSQGRATASTAASRAQHSRAASVDANKALTSTPTRGGPQHQTQAPTAAAGGHARLRPAFTTLQQHFSPAKSSAPKPLTSTFLAPPSPSKLPANVAASAETGRLQAELLQLHLLHRDAATVDAQWRASARHKLGKRYDALVSTSRDITEQERAQAEGDSTAALRRWAGAGTGAALEDRIQILDALINGLWTLSEPGGRYARTVRRFERWMDRVCEVEEARESGTALIQDINDDSGGAFVGELDAAWKDECAGIARRLDTWQRQLHELGTVPPPRNKKKASDGRRDEEPTGTAAPPTTSVERILQGCRCLVHDMLAEMELMEQMEAEALAREDDWIARTNRDEGDGVANDTPRAGAIWRVV